MLIKIIIGLLKRVGIDALIVVLEFIIEYIRGIREKGKITPYNDVAIRELLNKY